MSDVKRFSQISEIVRRVRASVEYARWVERNKSVSCVKCGTSDNLECHHVVELYHIVLGVWKFYGDWETTFRHVCQMHDNNMCEAATLCEKCHDSFHPGRCLVRAEENVRTEDWCVIPRNLPFPFSLGRKSPKNDSLGLVGFQTLIGIGWHIMNGYCSHRIVEFNRRRFAEVLGKTPSASFADCLDEALVSLKVLHILNGYHVKDGDVEAHLSQKYVDTILENPWFFPHDDLPTQNMTVLVLRWFLNMQSKAYYAISRDKLAEHLQFGTRTPSFVDKAVTAACKDIPWASVDIDNGLFRFKLANRGVVPVYSLRRTLGECLAV